MTHLTFKRLRGGYIETAFVPLDLRASRGRSHSCFTDLLKGVFRQVRMEIDRRYIFLVTELLSFKMEKQEKGKKKKEREKKGKNSNSPPEQTRLQSGP